MVLCNTRKMFKSQGRDEVFFINCYLHDGVCREYSAFYGRLLLIPRNCSKVPHSILGAHSFTCSTFPRHDNALIPTKPEIHDFLCVVKLLDHIITCYTSCSYHASNTPVNRQLTASRAVERHLVIVRQLFW